MISMVVRTEAATVRRCEEPRGEFSSCSPQIAEQPRRKS